MRRRTRQRRQRHILLTLGAASTAWLTCAATLNAQQLGAAALEKLVVGLPEVRHITLEQAQQQAAQALEARLGELSVEAAKEHRLGVRADYFPKVGATFANLHFNTFLGQEIVINRPIVGGAVNASLPLFGQDWTFLVFTAAQPITPLLKVRQAVRVARADEIIARAKAGMPVSTSSALEKTYFDLLHAQREMALAEANVRRAWAAPPPAGSALVAVSARPTDPTDARDADVRRQLLASSVRVNELTASLNELLGWPVSTRLELEAPSPLIETVSLQDALGKALTTNPEVIEAEQTVEKAKAAAKVSKLDYVPDVAVIGGFIAQDDVIPLLPGNFAYIGVLGTYNVFDSGKREHLIRERRAQVRMAETALELTKAKVAAAVKTSFAVLERSRTLSSAAREAESAARIAAKSDSDDLDVRTARIRLSLEALQLDYQHRQAYAELKTVIENPSTTPPSTRTSGSPARP